MQKAFKIVVFLQALLPFVYFMSVIIGIEEGNFLFTSISFLLTAINLTSFGIIQFYTQHNDIFKDIEDLRKERDAYRDAKAKYLNQQIEKVEGHSK